MNFLFMKKRRKLTNSLIAMIKMFMRSMKMCGRFTLTVNRNELIEQFQLSFFPDDYSPRYNIAPTQEVLAAVNTEQGKKAGYIKWGLVPFWVKETKKWKPLINARAESLTEKASFKHLVEKRRCVIFADSFYEWSNHSGEKKPYRILKKDRKPFAFAALWDRNEQSTTCTIITVQANELIKNLHERMPVIFTTNDEIEQWLEVKRPFTEVQPLLKPSQASLYQYYEVSPLVNSAQIDHVQCIQPVR